MSIESKIEYRECTSLEDLTNCVRLQRKVFELPEIELSPVRHFIVTLHAGGFTLGAFDNNKLVGFSLSVPAFLRGEKAFYSHMTAVDKEFQGLGIGRELKWKQREKSLKKGVKIIKWTFQPVIARNAYFNLEKLGAIVNKYKPNFYGTDYPNLPKASKKLGIDSDRLFAEWHLESEKVETLAKGKTYLDEGEVCQKIETLNDWHSLVNSKPKEAIEKQNQIKKEFNKAFSDGLICRNFERSRGNPKYLFYKK